MRFLPAALLALVAGTAGAQSVALQGMLGHKALLIVDGTAPRSLAPGESHLGVKVLATLGDQAVVEIGGRRHTLRVGDAPASVGASGGARGNRIVLTAGSGGHFVTPGTINGRAVQFMVDTGATGVGLSVADAERIGLNYRSGQAIRLSTANGVAQGWLVSLASVRVGDVEVHNVEAAVSPGAMPYVLLGNSFLTRFQMKRDNDQLVLERRF
ncbi:MAG TPA: TIGR02281 family clan AA aspartic protease [Ramlibacter sp.]|nr:TIGR02281 family clan AA aspartic protease [Ramlibacter sp.]